MPSEFLSVLEAASVLAVSEQHVRTLLRNKSLVGDRIGRSWIIPVDALDAYRNGSSCQTILRDQVITRDRESNYVALSFFSGALGLDLGLERAGIDVLLASEIDPATRETIAANRPGIALIGDIREYNDESIRLAAGLEVSDEIDLIVGGPPCQAFSTAGRRLGFHDERGNVFLKYIELIGKLKPKYAVIENVRGLMSAPWTHIPHELRGDQQGAISSEEQPGGALRYIIDLLQNFGYSVSFNLYNAANYGAPQIRERIIIICSRDGSRVPYLTPTHSNDCKFNMPTWRTFHDVTKDMPTNQVNHVNFPEKRLRFYKLLGPGQNWRNLPKELQQEAMGQSYFSGGGKTGFYRRLAWHEPAPTLVTHPAMPATDLAHPLENRPLSVQEYKRLQDFPDNWVVCGSIINQYRQLGNAVPVPLGEAIGKAILQHMKGEIVNEIPGFPYSRYRGTSDKDWNLTLQKDKKTKSGLQQKMLFS